MPETATQQTPLKAEAALSLYAEPTLNHLRPDHVARWAEGFGHEALASDILANPRLETRIVSEVCRSIGQTRVAEAPKSALKPVLVALAQQGPERLADLVGAALHWRSVLGWITWGQLGEFLPDLPKSQVRALLQKLDRELLEGFGPAGIAEDLTSEQIRADGEAALGAWRAGLPPLSRKRLELFYESWPASDEATATLVSAVAAALQDEGSA